MDASDPTRIIGGMFGLELPLSEPEHKPHFLNGEVLGLANARSAIRVVQRLVNPRRVWMPSFLCASMLDALERGVSAVHFYPVDGRLRIPDSRWLGQIGSDDLVVFIAYFGFPPDSDYVRAVRDRSGWVLTDASQALLTECVGEAADFVLFSPRKFVGVPDGGILVSRCGIPLQPLHLQPPPACWWLKAVAAAVGRWEFDRHGGDRRWFELFRDVESTAPIGEYAISDMARAVLQRIDYLEVARRRRRNYLMLSDALPGLALLPELPDAVVPLGFPVRCASRDRVRQELFGQGIFPPIHWPLAGIVPPGLRDSHNLSAEIMTLPCDQRYETSDMDRMVAVLLSTVDDRQAARCSRS